MYTLPLVYTLVKKKFTMVGGRVGRWSRGSRRDHTAVFAFYTFISRRSTVETVDNGNITEAVWCNHVAAIGEFCGVEGKRALLIKTPNVRVVIEEGKVKILCTCCWLRSAKQLSFLN